MHSKLRIMKTTTTIEEEKHNTHTVCVSLHTDENSRQQLQAEIVNDFMEFFNENRIFHVDPIPRWLKDRHM